ncbi:cytochrome P450 [Amorphus sp. 3PC139-8]|uniref:cytochrome P450 n=1 Tax=Amorphus sp. 3PC139-8 TaxID=2735676 RepID=UPI00345DAB1E
MSSTASDAANPTSIGRPVPSAPAPRTSRPGLIAAYRALNRNPITAFSERAYNEPIVSLIRPGRALLVSDPEAIEHILVHNAGNYRKSRQQQRRLQPALGSGLLTSEGEVWRSTRRLAAPLFSPAAVGHLFDDMAAATRQMAMRWQTAIAPDQAVDLAAEFQRLTYEIVSRTIFSGALDQDRAQIHAHMAIYFDTLGRIDLSSFFDLPEWWPSATKVKARTSLRTFRSVVDTVVKGRLEGSDGSAVSGDLLDRLMHASDPTSGRKLDADAIADNVLTFLAAGHETTGNALAWIFYLMGLDPASEARTRTEIDEVIGDGPVSREALDRLTFTKAVIDEAMRLYPPAPFIGREALASDEVAGHQVRKGSQLVISPWIVHRHRLLWDDPDQFRPERFLSEAAKTIPRSAFLPFGLGPRICIGQRFALQEILTVLAILVPRFRVRLADPAAVEPLARITLQPARGVAAYVTPIKACREAPSGTAARSYPEAEAGRLSY